MRSIMVLALLLSLTVTTAIAAGAKCPSGVDATKSDTLRPVEATSGCHTGESNGYPLPDPRCTPGAINPTVTLAVLQGGKFRTPCERNVVSSMTAKNATYDAYAIIHPKHNTGKTQVCELDHLISLEIGGSDDVANIWPQCGPENVVLQKRYFKQKDMVENYIAALIKSHQITTDDELQSYQTGIATDWTQYLAASQDYWQHHKPQKFGIDQ